MVAYVPDSKHDVFVSYAHVDDQPLPGAKDGWVTTLIEGIRIILNQKLGGKAKYDLWMDDELSRHVNITPQIMNTLQESAILLVVLSPAYIKSDWCLREKDTFLELIKERAHSGSRVFIVEYDKLEDSERPPEFGGLLGYRFWIQEKKGKSPRTLGVPKPNPDEYDYYNTLKDLSSALAEELKRLKTNINSDQTISPRTESSPIVYLAEPTFDLDSIHAEVKRYLNQAGLQVLPDTWYPREPHSFKKSVDKDLKRCKIFVQLLSETAGRKSADLPHGYVHLQHKRAKKASMQILQWRDPELVTASVMDEDHRKLLEGDTVHAVRIQTFKEKVTKQAFYKPPPKRQFVSAFVFVDMDASDQHIARQVVQILEGYGADHVLPLKKGKPAELRKDLERNLEECDGVIIIYGNTTVNWVREQLRQCRKIIARRESPLKALAVFEGPPEKDVPLDLRINPMQIINCQKGLEESELESFIHDFINDLKKERSDENDDE